MRAILLLTGVLFSLASYAFDYSTDCIDRYQHRIDQSSEWARLNYRFPLAAEKRAQAAQSMINLIEQAQEAAYVRYPGGRELVELTYSVNRWNSFSHQRRNIREVARVVRDAYQRGLMCPDYSNLWDMGDVRRHIRRAIK